MRIRWEPVIARAAGFVAHHGELMQVEVEAVHRDTLRELYMDAIAGCWDVSAYEAVVARGDEERQDLLDILDRVAGDG